MPIAKANGIDICYESFGEPSGRPLLLVMGLGTQMLGWHEEFCEQLVARGHWVTRFDNRDIGQSSQLDELGIPDVPAAMAAAFQGGEIKAPYLLRDMAADAVGLMDALGIDSAHVVGASMGGMIVQAMAIDFPSRVRSLTSIMSTTGERTLPQSQPEAIGALLVPPPPDREGAIQRNVDIFRTIGSPGFPFEEERIRERAGLSYDRGFNPAGVARQLMAIIASPSRREALRRVKIPALVIHGKADPLVPVEGGIDTAEALPNAELMLIDGMGHDLPSPLWPRLVEAISALTERAEAARRS